MAKYRAYGHSASASNIMWLQLRGKRWSLAPALTQYDLFV